MRYIFGRFFWVNVSEVAKYRGAWKNGLFNGLGRLIYKNGSEYNGFLKNGIRHGEGNFKSITGYSYSGQWISGHKRGHANIFYINGDSYHGFVKNGLRQGVGELSIYSSKTSINGTWKKDYLIG